MIPTATVQAHLKYTIFDCVSLLDVHSWGGGWKRWQEAAIILPGREQVESRPAAGSQGGKLLLCHFRIGNLQSGETFFYLASWRLLAMWLCF